MFIGRDYIDYFELFLMWGELVFDIFPTRRISDIYICLLNVKLILIKL